jgi:hypothetical protein
MSKDLKIKRKYFFHELPLVVQNDYLIQFEDEIEFEQSDCFFCVKIPYQKLLEEFDNMLGPNSIDELESVYVIKLAIDIELHGLHYPPICSEGIHKSLAHIYLKGDLLRFELVPKG